MFLFENEWSTKEQLLLMQLLYTNSGDTEEWKWISRSMHAKSDIPRKSSGDVHFPSVCLERYSVENCKHQYSMLLRRQREIKEPEISTRRNWNSLICKQLYELRKDELRVDLMQDRDLIQSLENDVKRLRTGEHDKLLGSYMKELNANGFSLRDASFAAKIPSTKRIKSLQRVTNGKDIDEHPISQAKEFLDNPHFLYNTTLPLLDVFASNKCDFFSIDIHSRPLMLNDPSLPVPPSTTTTTTDELDTKNEILNINNTSTTTAQGSSLNPLSIHNVVHYMTRRNNKSQTTAGAAASLGMSQRRRSGHTSRSQTSSISHTPNVPGTPTGYGPAGGPGFLSDVSSTESFALPLEDDASYHSTRHRKSSKTYSRQNSRPGLGFDDKAAIDAAAGRTRSHGSTDLMSLQEEDHIIISNKRSKSRSTIALNDLLDGTVPNHKQHHHHHHSSHSSLNKKRKYSSDSYMGIAMAVWEELVNFKHSNIFMYPVSNKVANYYTDMILQPMNLALMKRRIEEGVITTSIELARDIEILFTNAMMYNNSLSRIHTMAVEMRAFAHQSLIKHFPDLDDRRMLTNHPPPVVCESGEYSKTTVSAVSAVDKESNVNVNNNNEPDQIVEVKQEISGVERKNSARSISTDKISSTKDQSATTVANGDGLDKNLAVKQEKGSDMYNDENSDNVPLTTLFAFTLDRNQNGGGWTNSSNSSGRDKDNNKRLSRHNTETATDANDNNTRKSRRLSSRHASPTRQAPPPKTKPVTTANPDTAAVDVDEEKEKTKEPSFQGRSRRRLRRG